jgi:hypothetical protein
MSLQQAVAWPRWQLTVAFAYQHSAAPQYNQAPAGFPAVMQRNAPPLTHCVIACMSQGMVVLSVRLTVLSLVMMAAHRRRMEKMIARVNSRRAQRSTHEQGMFCLLQQPVGPSQCRHCCSVKLLLVTLPGGVPPQRCSPQELLP